MFMASFQTTVPCRNWWLIGRGFWNRQESNCLDVFAAFLAMAKASASWREAECTIGDKGLAKASFLAREQVSGCQAYYQVAVRIRAMIRSLRVLNALQATAAGGKIPKLAELGLPLRQPSTRSRRALVRQEKAARLAGLLGRPRTSWTTAERWRIRPMATSALARYRRQNPANRRRDELRLFLCAFGFIANSPDSSINRPLVRVFFWNAVNGGKRGQVQFVRSTPWAVPANSTYPLFPRQARLGGMATLQARLARGEPAAFAELYDACADRVGHYLLVRLGSWADADDALQETFLRLARTREKLAEVDNLEAYVITIARNEAARLAAGQGKTRAEARAARRRKALSIRPRRRRRPGECRDRGGGFAAIGAGLAGSRGVEDFFRPHVSADQPSDRAAARNGGHPLSLGLDENASLVCEATAMNDDVEQRLSRLTPRGVRPELRGQVLAAVADELQGDVGVPRWNMQCRSEVGPARCPSATLPCDNRQPIPPGCVGRRWRWRRRCCWASG